ncbi:hypothetical protein DBR32_07320 [Taibaiella sp. KBW10]|uniref:T9SS type A sorting domain-containing protein n=1 Tax=Taibaiella sp. KBW10 TaxID=2153357 RepID=UPI000F5B01B3|nr:T9SS type A sorting domain-containing protein [Taibaiella sp. KBW10]RQO31748.1 hypothetical protein DBR32_07320 [Taibaiella sp. KBW10]
MKKTLLALAAVISIGMSYAQSPVKRYTATYTTGGTYTPLSGATDIGFNADWDDTVSNPITLPFAFKYQNVAITTVAVETYGSLLLNNVINEMTTTGHITGLNMDYTSAGRGKVFYTTTGTTGNRIFKVEYRNVGRFNDDTGNDTLNFQVWLYESDHAIEYRAGYKNVNDTMFATDLSGAMDDKEVILAGLIGNSGDSLAIDTANAFFHATKRTGAVFSDTAIWIAAASSNPLLLGELLHGTYPPNGSVIRFAPRVPSAIGKIDFDMASIYPNPSKDGIYNLNLKETPKTGALVTIYDMTGKVVLKQALHTTKATLDLGRFAAGNYFGKINNGDRIGSFKLIKE